MSHTNYFPPERMSPQQRRDEVAQLLATGLIRLRQGSEPTSLPDWERQVSLDKTTHRSVHGEPQPREQGQPHER